MEKNKVIMKKLEIKNGCLGTMKKSNLWNHIRQQDKKNNAAEEEEESHDDDDHSDDDNNKKVA
jgi:hypothetical protein